MSAKKILIVEDDPRIAQNIEKGLSEKGFETTLAIDGPSGEQLGSNQEFDLILLDVNLPGLSGYSVCERIRKTKPSVPIIMLTALGETEDKILGFDKGADDYIVKPFDFRELLARVNVFLKRNSNADTQFSKNILKVANLEIDTEFKSVKRENQVIELTQKEFSLLEYLILNKNKIISKNEISDHIWDQKNQQSLNLVEVYINFLRKKIDKDFEPKLIHTKSGMGYILKVEES
jgi:two-component system, OmpR family, copper resistance phosphate regulon response regulator CusR